MPPLRWLKTVSRACRHQAVVYFSRQTSWTRANVADGTSAIASGCATARSERSSIIFCQARPGLNVKRFSTSYGHCSASRKKFRDQSSMISAQRRRYSGRGLPW